jgi:hypothetical protein
MIVSAFLFLHSASMILQWMFPFIKSEKDSVFHLQSRKLAGVIPHLQRLMCRPLRAIL